MEPTQICLLNLCGLYQALTTGQCEPRGTRTDFSQLRKKRSLIAAPPADTFQPR